MKTENESKRYELWAPREMALGKTIGELLPRIPANGPATLLLSDHRGVWKIARYRDGRMVEAYVYE